MAFKEQEVLAALRVLVCVAKADGVIRVEEREALQAALSGTTLPEDVSVDRLLQEDVDLREQLALLRHAVDREKVYEATLSMAYAEGECSPEERRMLEEVRMGLGISEEKASVSENLARDIGQTLVPGSVEPIANPEKRARAVDGDIWKYSVIAAALGAFPVPIADIAVSIAIVGLQAKMFHDIGRTYGFTTSKEQVKNLIGGVGVGTGARIAVVSVAKFIPGWGSLVGAVTSFASTYALGKVAKRYYDDGGRADVEELRDLFSSAEREGRAVYHRDREEIERKSMEARPKIERLARQLKEGQITTQEYEQKIASLK